MRQLRDFGAFLPWVPVVGSVLMMMWMLDLNPLAYSGGRVVKLMIVAVLVSALLGLLEAERIRRGEPEWEVADEWLKDLTPPMWFAAIVLVWPIAFPVFAYMYYYRMNRLRTYVAWTGTAMMLLGALALWPRMVAPPPPPELPALVVGGGAGTGVTTGTVSGAGTTSAIATPPAAATSIPTPRPSPTPTPVVRAGDDGSPRPPVRVTN